MFAKGEEIPASGQCGCMEACAIEEQENPEMFAATGAEQPI